MKTVVTLTKFATDQRQPFLLRASLPRTRSDHASMQRAQSLRPSDHRRHTHSPAHRPSDQLYRQARCPASAEHPPVRPAKHIHMHLLKSGNMAKAVNSSQPKCEKKLRPNYSKNCKICGICAVWIVAYYTSINEVVWLKMNNTHLPLSNSATTSHQITWLMNNDIFIWGSFDDWWQTMNDWVMNSR